MQNHLHCKNTSSNILVTFYLFFKLEEKFLTLGIKIVERDTKTVFSDDGKTFYCIKTMKIK